MRVARHEPPDRVVSARRLPAPRHALVASIVALLVGIGAILPGPAAAATTWSRNLFVWGAFLYQDPYYTACTAASTMIMLNTIAARGTGGPGFAWTPYRVRNNTVDPTDVRDMVSILAFERANDTLRATSPGSDAHGWRNALNFYGWGQAAMTDPSRMVYVDRAYRSFNSAIRAAVRAIATRGMPVGILGWAGGHAQVMTGYVVTGANPATSSDFTVQSVYLTDPLRKDRIVNRRISFEKLRSGALKYRFQRYRETDSPYDDPYTSGVLKSSVAPKRGPSEWHNKWVIIAPVRSGIVLPPASPTPNPSDAATPPPVDPSSSTDPSASAGAGPITEPSPSLDATATDSPSPGSDAEVQQTATSPQSSLEPSADPSAAASAAPTPTIAPASSSPDAAPTSSPSASSSPADSSSPAAAPSG